MRTVTVLLLLFIFLVSRASAVICTPNGTFTTNYSLCKPQAGEVNWSAAMNANMDQLDTTVKSVSSSVVAAALDGTRNLKIGPSTPGVVLGNQGTFNNAGNSYTASTASSYNLFDGTVNDGFIISTSAVFQAVNVVIFASASPGTVEYATCQSGTWTVVTPTTTATWTSQGFTQIRGIPTSGWTTGTCGTTNVTPGNFNLRVRQTSGTTTVTGHATLAEFHDVTADEIVASDTGTNKFITKAFSVVVNARVNGANGLDMGSLAMNTYYFEWGIFNPTTVTWAGMLSTSSTAPTMPSGYTAKVLLGGYRADANAILLPWYQYKDWVGYPQGVKDLTNATILSTATTTISATVPPIAVRLRGQSVVEASVAAEDLFIGPFPMPAGVDLSANPGSGQSNFLYFGTQTGGRDVFNFEVDLVQAQTYYVIAGSGSAANHTLWTNGYRMPGNVN